MGTLRQGLTSFPGGSPKAAESTFLAKKPSHSSETENRLKALCKSSQGKVPHPPPASNPSSAQCRWPHWSGIGCWWPAGTSLSFPQSPSPCALLLRHSWSGAQPCPAGRVNPPPRAAASFTMLNHASSVARTLDFKAFCGILSGGRSRRFGSFNNSRVPSVRNAVIGCPRFFWSIAIATSKACSI